MGIIAAVITTAHAHRNTTLLKLMLFSSAMTYTTSTNGVRSALETSVPPGRWKQAARHDATCHCRPAMRVAT
jgi:hypothetical protein